MDITVVGAGIIGLTTALTLEEQGHSVRVIAAATGDATTSAIAGASCVILLKSQRGAFPP